MVKKVFDNEVILPEVARLIEQGHSVTIPVRGNSMNPFWRMVVTVLLWVVLFLRSCKLELPYWQRIWKGGLCCIAL